MSCLWRQGSDRSGSLQGESARGWGHRFVRLALPAAVVALAGCATNPVMTPVGWWHDLEGGEIAARRPPPPGQDLPYPKMNTIPARPVLPSAAFRDSLQTQLTAERDDAERLAARNPVVVTAPPPPPKPVPPPPPNGAAPPDDQTANASLPAADTPPPATPSAVLAPPPIVPVTLAGAAADTAGLPDIPAAPPSPATFEGVPALPAPSPLPPLPAHVPAALRGREILFASGSAVLAPSQRETLKDVAAHRGKQHIEIEGFGEAAADTPDAQAAAVSLGLERARAVADGLAAQQVPGAVIRLSAAAFGRGAAVRFVP